MNRSTLVLLVGCGAAFSLGCGGADDSISRSATGKPDQEMGGEALVFPASAALPESRGEAPTPGDVELRVYHASPVGPISGDALAAYRIYVEAENVGAAPITLEPAWVRAAVERNGAPVPGCEGEPSPVRDGDAVGTGGALFVSVPLPCALDDGEYRVEVDFSVGAPPGEPGATLQRELSSSLSVDGSLPAFQAGWMPPAR